MAKVKVVTNNLDYNLNREEFTDFPSQTIFSFGRFSITSNFDGRNPIDYTNVLNSFSNPITLETLDLNEIQSTIVEKKATSISLNLDKGNFNSFVRFGSAYEFLRTSIEEIIMKYPGSLFINNQATLNGNNTVFDFVYDSQQNVSTFKIVTGSSTVSYINNYFGIIYKDGNNINPDNNELRNLNNSFTDYVVWSNDTDSNGVIAPIIAFTGYSDSLNYMTVQTEGNPFDGITFTTNASIPFHIKPNSKKFEEFRQQLTDYQKYIISSRNDNDFIFEIKEPVLLDNGNIEFNNIKLVWPCSDGYNVDFSGISYRNFLDRLLRIGGKYDAIKTDLIARFLSPTSLKTYDLTEEGKITKLLRVYGWEFDQLRTFIDSLAYVNRVTYDKKNNAPDQIIANLAKLFGWKYFSLVNEPELVESLLTIDERENDLNDNLLPVEIDIELWRRIIMNTNYFWKTKGTREAIKSMFLLIGIPEPFINITEYVYTVSDKINPNQVTLQPMDFVSNSYPFDSDGYPIAPPETTTFYFQISGDTDSGQAYMDNFRYAGFNLERTVDNKKSWTEEGEIIRQHDSTIQYYQKDSKLVLNTKEVDIALDAARGIEEDVFDYLQDDYSVNSTGQTVPISYVNITTTYTDDSIEFPVGYDINLGNLEVRVNGLLLDAPSIDGVDDAFEADYSVTGSTIIIPKLPELSGGTNVIQLTYIDDDSSSPITGVTYTVTRIPIVVVGTTATITLPTKAMGDVQLTVEGIALTKKTAQFNADYYVDNSSTSDTVIVIHNPNVISYMNAKSEKYLQVAYINVEGNTSVEAKSEIHRVDSYNSSKFYFNSYANRFVYVLNHKIRNVENVKILIDGIALAPINDYVVNPNNQFELYLPRNIKFGSVISAYYLVGGDEYYETIINDIFGLGDIGDLSFMEFAELAQRKLINARTRKVITDFKGGWYPTLLKLYVEYLKRAELEDENPLQSNGYEFETVLNFLSKYNTFFEKFVNQLLSATIILRKSGLLVRNSMFTRQKFTYKRGVAYDYKYLNQTFGLASEGVQFNTVLNYLGDAGSMFMIPQQENILTPSLNTIIGSSTANSITNTGGNNIVMFDSTQFFGMEYKKFDDAVWQLSPDPPYDKSIYDAPFQPSTPFVNANSFTGHTITGLEPDTRYQYRAFIEINDVKTYGEIRDIDTLAMPIAKPSLETIQGSAARIATLEKPIMYIFAITGTGGNNIVRWEDADSYAVQWRSGTLGTWNVTPLNNTPLTGNSFTDITISGSTGLTPNTVYQYRSYMIVDGIEHFGQTRQITTLDYPFAKPDVTTGNAYDVTTSGMTISGNSVDDSNGSNVTQYGIIWTQNSLTGNNLDYSNKAGAVEVTGVPINGGLSGITHIITGLSENTQTWFRFYGKNSVGFGYGDVKIQLTDQPPIVTTRNLDITIIPTGSTGTFEIDGEFIIRDSNTLEIIDTILIPTLTSSYHNLIPNIQNSDYYIDASLIRLWNGTDYVQQAVMGYQWLYGIDELNPTYGSQSGTVTELYQVLKLIVSGGTI